MTLDELQQQIDYVKAQNVLLSLQLESVRLKLELDKLLPASSDTEGGV